MKFRTFLLSLCATTILSPAAFAVDRTWDAGGDGTDWADPLNWSGDTVPTSTDRAIINTPAGPNVTAAVPTANRVDVGTAAASTGGVTVSGGGTVSSSGPSVIGTSATGAGSATVTGSGSAWASGNQMRVGDSGSGTLRIEDGGAVSSNGTSVIGNNATGTGNATVSGAGSTWTAGSEVRVGNAGNGTLLIEDGGAVTSTSHSYIGYGSTGTGSATVTGAESTWTAGDKMVVGNRGNGELTVSNSGTVSSAGDFNIGLESSSTGTLNIGAAAADPAAAPGSVNAERVVFGEGTGTINFNHTAQAYAFTPDIEGNGTINAVAGNTLLAGETSGFTGTINVATGANVTTGAAVERSLQDTAGTIQEAMVTGRAVAGEMLGAARPVDQENQMSAGAVFGSIAGMVSGQYAGENNALIGGVAYGEADRSGMDQDPAVTVAVAVRHRFPDVLNSAEGQTLTPYVEAGGWVTPEQDITLSRRYALIGGEATAKGTTETTGWAGYGRIGMVWDAGPDQVTGYGEFGQQGLHHDGYTETGGPFPAEIEDGTMRFKVIRAGGSYTRKMDDIAPIPLSATVSAAVARAFDRQEALRGNVAGVGFSGEADTSGTWGEYGARIEAGVTDDTAISVGVSGTTGDAAAMHGIIAIRHKL